jgi:hypothetical protein
MANHRGGVVGGVDAHADEHHVAVVDLQGRLLGATAFPTTAAGYALLISWLREQGKVDRVGVESTGAYAAGLVRALAPAESASSRSTSRTGTRGSGSARATRSTPSSPLAQHLAEPPLRCRNRRAGSWKRSGS